MSQKLFRLCRITITIAIVVLVGWSVTVGNALLPIFAIAGGMGLMYLCTRRVKTVIRDERIYRISEKASRATIGIFGPVIAVVAAVLIALSKTASTGFGQAGFTLAYSACALMVIYYIFYLYYSSKS